MNQSYLITLVTTAAAIAAVLIVRPPDREPTACPETTAEINSIPAFALQPVAFVREGKDLQPHEATPADDSILRRFVEECVLIEEGHLSIPALPRKDDEPRENRGEADRILKVSSFRICKYETTQELYQRVTGANPSRWQGIRNSVDSVNFNEAIRFCEQLTLLLRQQKLIDQSAEVRLPTAAEWEYACRAGATTKFCFGNSARAADGTRILDEYAWHTENAAGNDPAVGALKANRWQLADVHGYLWEFTQETPAREDTVKERVEIHGGSWQAAPEDCGCGSVRQVSRDARSADLGFRCVISPKVDIKNTKRR